MSYRERNRDHSSRHSKERNRKRERHSSRSSSYEKHRRRRRSRDRHRSRSKDSYERSDRRRSRNREKDEYRHRDERSKHHSVSGSAHDRHSYVDTSTKESTSLMVKFVNSEFLTPGIDETTIFDIFSGFAQVKDIRLIRDKFEPEKFRNFIFVEYYSIQDAEKVISTVK